MTTTDLPTNGTAPMDRPPLARPTGPQRPSIHAYCTHLAHRRWHNIGVANGFSVSALIEAIAPYLAVSADGDQLHQTIDLAAAIKVARRIDSDRRRRR